MKTYLITGGAGFIGHALSNRLVSEGNRVIALDNERSGSWARVDERVDRDTRGIQDLSLDDWQERLDGVDVVFHLAAEKYNSSNSSPETVIEVNVVATDRLFRASAGTVDKVVFTSSLYAYGATGPATMKETDVPAPVTHYGVSKLAGEHLLRTVSREKLFNWTVARLFFIYGPRQYAGGGYKSVIVSNFERMRRGERPTICGDGLQSLDYVYLDDCVDALIRLAEHDVDGETFNVASDLATDIVRLTDEMTRIAGSSATPEYIDADWTHGSRRVGSNSLVKARTGWSPSTPILEGLERVWNWMEEQ